MGCWMEFFFYPGMGWDGMRDGNFFSIPGWDDPGIGIEIFFHPGIGRDRDRISRDDPGIGIDFSSRHPASIPLFRENILKIFQIPRFNWIKDF